MKIEFKEKQEIKEPIGVGDFIMVGSYLCLIAQTGQGLVKLICLSTYDANRKNDVVYNYHSNNDEYKNFSHTALLALTGGQSYQKVEVTLIVQK